jgi:hypothetical protein
LCETNEQIILNNQIITTQGNIANDIQEIIESINEILWWLKSGTLDNYTSTHILDECILLGGFQRFCTANEIQGCEDRDKHKTKTLTFAIHALVTFRAPSEVI